MNLSFQLIGEGVGSANDGGIWQNAIMNSIAAWNNAGVGANITASATSTSNYKIQVMEREEDWYGLCHQTFSSSSGSTTQCLITLNSSELPSGTTESDANFRQSTAVHEIGHLLSLKDNPDVETANDSIMSGNRDRTVVTTPQDFDIENVRFRYDSFE